jgi:hypothetical protein
MPSLSIDQTGIKRTSTITQKSPAATVTGKITMPRFKALCIKHKGLDPDVTGADQRLRVDVVRADPEPTRQKKRARSG